jgi:outer membrane usher protein
MCATALWTRTELAALALLSTLGGAAGAQTAAPVLDPVVVGLVLNGSLLADAQLLHREPAAAGQPARMWLPVRAAHGWRMATAGRELRDIEGQPHAAFCRAPDRCFYDEASAVFTLALQSADLQPLRIAPESLPAPALTDSQARGAYLNYDLSAWRVGRPGLAALLEGRAYTPQGHGALLVDALYSNSHGQHTRAAGVWQVDRPQQGVSYQGGNIGIPDTVFGAGVPLFGLRAGSNSRLQPTLQTTLRPQASALAGERALRADVFVDGLYRQTAEVPYGPYSVEVAPSYPGRGQMDIVTTDASGLQQRISLPFYQAPQLLAPGVREWSLDAGVLEGPRGSVHPRGNGIVSGALRQGVGSATTAQWAALAAPGALRLAVAADSVDARRGLSALSLVVQRSPTRPQAGAWLGAGHEYLSRSSSFSLRAEQALQACGAAGVDAAAAAGTAAPMADRLARPCRRYAATLGVDPAGHWSAAAALSGQLDTQGRRSAVSFVGLRWQLDGRSQLALSAQRVAAGSTRAGQVLLSWSRPLSSDWSGQVGAQRRAGHAPSLAWAVQSVPPPAQASAQRWQLQGNVGPQADLGARYNDRGALADWRAEAHADARGLQGAVGVAGAVGVTGGRVFATRRIDDAFVVVDVGLPDLPVLLDNREVARTNAAGWAVVSDARAHQANVVGVDTSALPIDYAMPRDTLVVVPGSAAGVLARFDLSDGGVSVAVTDQAGQALPAGATVRVSTQSLATAVTSRSEVFIDRSNREAEVHIRWPGHACGFRYQPQSDTGAYTCVAE